MSKYHANIVTSYPNPDTDGVACSIAMANLLSSQKEEWIPVVLGSIGDETSFVLKHLGLTPPDSDAFLSGTEKITLVDTHHKAQLPPDFPFDKVVSIVDHHPNGNEDLFSNATIVNEKVGAAASLVAQMHFERKRIDKPILALLGFAILSNTLNFSAPSTTEFDRNMFNEIIGIVPISDDLIDEMLEQRSLVLKRDMYTALCSDFKVFDTKSGEVGISQIEAYNLEALIDIPQTIAALQCIAAEKQLTFCLFNGADIKSKRSIVLGVNDESKKLLCSIFQLEQYEEPQIFDRILLRKTDFIPQLNMEMI
ncbi:MAG: DHH family phosphoesterase [Oscillospiraceae bacterium]|nr:DHH family phosphoesterase [Oscillospiraceae bacterium]